MDFLGVISEANVEVPFLVPKEFWLHRRLWSRVRSLWSQKWGLSRQCSLASNLSIPVSSVWQSDPPLTKLVRVWMLMLKLPNTASLIWKLHMERWCYSGAEGVKMWCQAVLTRTKAALSVTVHQQRTPARRKLPGCEAVLVLHQMCWWTCIIASWISFFIWSKDYACKGLEKAVGKSTVTSKICGVTHSSLLPDPAAYASLEIKNSIRKNDLTLKFSS